MNNLSNAFNIIILVARDKPIISMREWIIKYLMSRIVSQRGTYANYEHRIMPRPKKRLDVEFMQVDIGMLVMQ